MRRQPGEEDEVRAKGRIPQPEPNPISLGQPITRRFPRPSRFSPKCVSPVMAQPDSLDSRPASPVQRRHAQPNSPTLFLQPNDPSPANDPKPASDPITRASTRDPYTRVALWLCHGTSAARLRRLNLLGGGFSAPATYSARSTYFQPICYHFDPLGLSFGPV